MEIPGFKNDYEKSGFTEFTGTFINWLFFMLTSVLFILAVYDLGYKPVESIQTLYHHTLFRYLFPITGILYIVRSVFFIEHKKNRKVFIANIMLGFLLVLVFLIRIIWHESVIFHPLFHRFTVFHFFAFTLFIFEFSQLKIENAIRLFNPAQLFIVSFALIIIFGTFLLLMPGSTTSHINFTDAFFTSTSAVCVTGLTVVDTASGFTSFGRLIILGLIQVGGIGVMTITSFFGFFFKETSSFREQMLIRDYLNEDSYSGILKTLIKIIFIVFSIELVGAALIFYSLYSHGLQSVIEDLKFSIFHSISAFCNAGFSTLSDGLFDTRFRINYQLQFWIANLIILGGLGFPVFLNIYSYIKAQFNWLKEFILHRKPYQHRVGMITFHTKIVFITTFALLIIGAVLFLVLEFNSAKNGAPLSERIGMSWFLSVTPRTAGFNTVNMEVLSKSTLLIVIFLMWVGASPVSTAGGIKTSTFIIMLLNVIRIIKGKNHIEILRHEIHEFSVNKAFAIVFMSLILIATGSFFIYLIDGEQGLFRIVFECFSAFGTVGLTLNLTPLLSVGSKWILILLMFMGRMGIVTLLFSLSLKASKSVAYRYPKENLIIT